MLNISFLTLQRKYFHGIISKDCNTLPNKCTIFKVPISIQLTYVYILKTKM